MKGGTLMAEDQKCEKNKVFYPSENSWARDNEGLHLIGTHCKKCGQSYFPPTEICPDCYVKGAEGEIAPLKLSSKGRLYSFTIVQIAPARFMPPYALGYVDFPEGVRVLGQLTTKDPQQLKMDMNVEVELGKIAVDDQGNEIHSYKFRPLQAT